MTYLNCVAVGDQSLIATVPAIDCHSDDYRAFRIFLLTLLILLVIGSPLVIFGFLLLNRGNITNPRFRERFSILFEAFSPACYFWNSVVLVRRSALVAITLVPDYMTRNALFGFLTLLFLLVHLRAQPYGTPAANAAEGVSLVGHVCIALFLNTSTGQLGYTLPIRVLVFILVVTTSIGLAALILRQLFDKWMPNLPLKSLFTTDLATSHGQSTSTLDTQAAEHSKSRLSLQGIELPTIA